MLAQVDLHLTGYYYMLAFRVTPVSSFENCPIKKSRLRPPPAALQKKIDHTDRLSVHLDSFDAPPARRSFGSLQVTCLTWGTFIFEVVFKRISGGRMLSSCSA